MPEPEIGNSGAGKGQALSHPYGHVKLADGSVLPIDCLHGREQAPRVVGFYQLQAELQGLNVLTRAIELQQSSTMATPGVSVSTSTVNVNQPEVTVLDGID